MASHFGRRMTGFSAAIVLLLSAMDSNATVYRCTEAKDEAVLGVNRSVSSNHGDKKCRWSVDGASIERRPDANAAIRNRTVSALNMLIEGRFNNLFRGSQEIRQFGELLIGPFYGADIPFGVMNSFENAVRNSADRFGACIASRGNSGITSDNNLLCDRISPERERDRIFNVWSIEVLPTEPIVVMGVNMGGQRYMLFLPERYLAGRLRLP